MASVQGGDPLAQTQRGCLQSRRARVHQQISKELRMRAGAENLYRCARPAGRGQGVPPAVPALAHPCLSLAFRGPRSLWGTPRCSTEV